MKRYSARVANDATETTIEEEAVSETALRQSLAARGWSRVLSVVPLAAPDPEIRHDGDWVYVPDHIAERHPLYGVGGWLILLMVLLAIGALLGVIGFFRIVGVAGASGLVTVLVVLLGVVTAAQVVCIVLAAMKSAAFPPVFLVIALLSILFGVLGLAVGDRPRLGEFLGIAVNTIWAVYVVVSRRVNVTYRKRVRADDAQFADILAEAEGR